MVVLSQDVLDGMTRKERYAVAELNKGRTQLDVACELDVAQSTIHRWAVMYGARRMPAGRRKKVVGDV